MDRRLTSKEEVEMKKLISSFQSKLSKFHDEGMRKLVARWEYVINKDGDYIEH
ncbi:unnamed protein product [Hymenolepis diminuta]|uniref:Uncharacterized protein n=1 Tax=Hymenolepis diminuta TaxID=6216 RepID=A0A564XUW8_HYMDI|nr:unnamed protein product [Hymenolepis diminuta]